MSIITFGSQFDLTACDALLSATQDFECKRQRRHEFWVLTCYMSLPVIQKVLPLLIENIRITHFYLAFNFSEIFKEGPSATEDSLAKIDIWCRQLNINFEWKALSSSSLIHAKGYAVIQRVKSKVDAGATLITSANFTEAGFLGRNVEIGYLSAKKSDAQKFEESYNNLWYNFGSAIDLAIGKEEAYVLKYSILASGVFLHKWTGSLSQLVGIKYSLTDEAKERGTIAPELHALGFKSGDTFTRQVLPLTDRPAKEIPREFITSFTIETHWGRWCPKDAWDTIKQHLSGAEPFILAFKDATTPEKIDNIMNEAQEKQEKLIELGLIKEVSSAHVERWTEKINSLRDNKGRLERLFTGYEDHALPYEFENTRHVEDLFDSLLETIELLSNQNKAIRKVHTTLESGNLGDLKLDAEDIKHIKKMMIS